MNYHDLRLKLNRAVDRVNTIYHRIIKFYYNLFNELLYFRYE